MSFCLHPLAAQNQPGDTITGKTHRIDDVTVTARRKPARITSTVPVQMISQQDIEQLGIQNMADAVRRFAGANVKDYGGIGGLKTVSVRNMGAAHTAVSYDGVAVSNCQGGQIDVGRFSLDNVEMLSLAIGQAEEMLQSARLYASAGVLSIETEKPHFDEGRKSAFRARVRGGSFGYVSPSLRWWQQLGSRTTLSADGTYLRADGNYPFRLVNGKYVTDEKRNNSAIYSWQGEANLHHTLRDSSLFSLKAYYYSSKRGLPGAVTLYNPLSTEKLWDENYFAQAQYRKRFNGQWSLKAQAKYTYGWNRMCDYGTPVDNGFYTERYSQDEYYLSAALLYQPTQAFSVSLAQDGAINTMESNLKGCPFPTRYTSITALHGRYTLPWLRIDASVVNTATKEKVKEGEAPDNVHRLSPTLSFSLRPWADEELYLRLMYKSTFRLPTFNDLYYYRLGNRSLNPEKANEFNLGLTWSRSGWGPLHYLNLTVDGYYNLVDDKIVAFPGTFTWRMVNYGKVHASGVDATASLSFPLARRINVVMTGAYMWQKAIDLTDKTSKLYKGQLPYTPLHSGNASAQIETPWVNVGYSLVGVSKRYYLEQNLPENEIDGYMEHTLTLSRKFTMKRSSCTLRAECINLTNEQYDVIKYYPMPGRSWRISIDYTF